MHVIRAAQVFDGERFLGPGVVVLADGAVVDVARGRVEVASDAEVLDHPGTLLPGLVDCHTHLVADATFGGLERVAGMTDAELDAVIADSLARHLCAGVTTVRDLGDRGYRTLRFRSRHGLPRVVAAGPPLTTPGGHCHFLGGVVEGDVRAAVDEHVERGVDVIKVMASGGFATPGTDEAGAQFARQELADLVERAHHAGVPVVAHAHALVGIEHALAAGVDGIEHLTGLTATGVRLDDALLDDLAERGMAVDLTMGNDRSLHALLTEPPPQLERLIRALGATSFDDLYASRLALYPRMRAHGVRVVSGVDSGMGPFKPHGSVWRAVGEMVEQGYPVADALVSVTSGAADACGVGSLTGRLAPRYAADLLLVDGDVSTDPGALGHPQHVLVRGTPVTPGTPGTPVTP